MPIVGGLYCNPIKLLIVKQSDRPGVVYRRFYLVLPSHSGLNCGNVVDPDIVYNINGRKACKINRLKEFAIIRS
jgi:hypothetical protein